MILEDLNPMIFPIGADDVAVGHDGDAFQSLYRFVFYPHRVNRKIEKKGSLDDGAAQNTHTKSGQERHPKRKPYWLLARSDWISHLL